MASLEEEKVGSVAATLPHLDSSASVPRSQGTNSAIKREIEEEEKKTEEGIAVLQALKNSAFKTLDGSEASTKKKKVETTATTAATPVSAVPSEPPSSSDKNGRRIIAQKETKSLARAPPGKDGFDLNTEKDVVLANRLGSQHPGYQRYRKKWMELAPQYGDLLGNLEGQLRLAQSVVDYIELEIGGRFMQPGTMGWVPVDRDLALHKTRRSIKEKWERSYKNLVKGVQKPKVESKAQVPRSNKSKAAKTALSGPLHQTSVPPKKRQVESVEYEYSYYIGAPKRLKTNNAAKTVIPPKEFVYEEDPNQFYVEETAHRYHNPPLPGDTRYSNWIRPDQLRPIPPPPPPPTLPTFRKIDSCRWEYDSVNRVVIADFSVRGDGPLKLEDTRLLFELQERDDITVISRGLLDLSLLDPSLWNLDYLGRAREDEFYHKFRRFDRSVDKDGFEHYVEKDRLHSMKFKDFVRYCELRKTDAEKRKLDPTPEESVFTFQDHNGTEHSLGVWTSALYLIDMDMKRLLPTLYDNFMESFQLPAVLPGGSNCLMNHVTPSARPFMGPNLYVTPPASFTHFHQDGHGTVDSGHLCIHGYNEVIMLRRLTERHKKHALWILSGKRPDASYFDGLYQEPHGDGIGAKPTWATNEMVEECRRMGYCPSVCILEPGDLIHINKGRLHAFRKLSTCKLPEFDCHAEQRKHLVARTGISGLEKMCISVAWDWMNRGVTPDGINREVCTVLEGTILNKRSGVTSLAIPELSLLQMATFVPSKARSDKHEDSFLRDLGIRKRKAWMFEPSKEAVCQGILPGLHYVADQHIAALGYGANPSTEKGERVSVAEKPDAQENPALCPLDPYGNTDFDCKICRMELSNVYYHCDGCELLLNKDFNICRDCHSQKKFMINHQMHPSNPKKKATLNHTGKMNYDRQSKCPCKNGPKCDYCGYCLGCSCRCHSWFTVHTRLFPLEQEQKLLKNVEETAKTGDGAIDDTRVGLALERLKHAKGESEPPAKKKYVAVKRVSEPVKDAEKGEDRSVAVEKKCNSPDIVI